MFFWSSVNNHGTNFVETHFIFKSSVNICWHELQDKTVISEISSMVRQWSALIALWTFSRFSSCRQVEGQPDLGWALHDIPPPLQRQYHWYTWVLFTASSLKAFCSIKTVSAAHFPNRKQNFTHILCSLLSAITKINEFPSRHLEKKASITISQPRLMPCSRLLDYCVDSRHLTAHRTTNSSLCTTFKFWLFLDPPTYTITLVIMQLNHNETH